MGHSVMASTRDFGSLSQGSTPCAPTRFASVVEWYTQETQNLPVLDLASSSLAAGTIVLNRRQNERFYCNSNTHGRRL